PVNLNFTAGKESLDSVIRQCRVKTILTSKAFVTRVKIERLPEMVFLEEILQRIGSLEKWLVAFLAFLLPSRLIGSFFSPGVRDPYSLATVIFTSGSTGEPKGVMLSHHNILSNIEGISQIFWLSRKERVMGVLPFFHSFGFTGTLWFPLIVRCGAVYHTSPTDAKTVGEMVRRYQAAILISTPTFYAAYIQRCAPEAFSSVRYAIVGAEKLREQVADAFHEKFGLELLEGYGCTELGPVISANIPDVVDGSARQRGRSFGTVGHPIPGVAVKIVNPDTKMAVPTGQEGLLLVKGPNLMMGYLHQPEKTKAVIEDGWYDTGDIASIDENGFIRIAGRLSRFSKIGGEMVPHLKIEEAVNRIIGESGCAVTGVPDTLKGERLIVLYANNKLSPRDLWEQLRVSGLPQLWIPKQENIYYIGAIPTLGTGKTDLRKVKLIALERLGEGKDRIARHD
ncbi:MAG: AMP-binding protein, partial [Nitrospiria bacterium]